LHLLHIIETVALIPSKFCTMKSTTQFVPSTLYECSHTTNQNGGWPLFWKEYL